MTSQQSLTPPLTEATPWSTHLSEMDAMITKACCIPRGLLNHRPLGSFALAEEYYRRTNARIARYAGLLWSEIARLPGVIVGIDYSSSYTHWKKRRARRRARRREVQLDCRRRHHAMRSGLK